MKHKLMALWILFGGTLLAQEKWTTPVVITTQTVSPDFDIDPRNGELHIVTVGSAVIGSRGVTYTKTDSLCGLLLQEAVPGAEEDAGGWTFGPSVGVDADGNPHVGFRRQVDTGMFSTFYVRKQGQVWSSPLMLSYFVNRGYMIRIALDGSNRAHIARAEAVASPYGNATYIRIADGSITRTIGELEPYRSDDRLEIDASADGIVHLVMGCPSPSDAPVPYYRSVDGGNTMDFVGDIHSTQCTGKNGSPDVFADKSGNVHICYGAKVDEAVNGKPSVRYVRYESGQRVRDTTATRQGVLEENPPGDEGWGLGTVAASDDGQTVGIAYLTQGGGDLYFTLSPDAGATWNDPEFIAGGVGSGDGRSFPVLRAYRNNFYLVYPQGQDVLLTALRNAGDMPPVADAGGPYSGFEGSPIAFNGSGSHDSGANAGIAAYAWDFESDGAWDAVSASPIVQHAYPDVFNGTVRLKVTDRAGFTSEAAAAVTVGNVAPTVDVGADQSGKEGDTFHFQAVVQDPGQESHVVAWNFGDSKTAQGPSQNHVFVNDGVFWVKATATDSHGAAGKDSLRVTVVNAPPVAEAGGPYVGKKGDTITFHGSAADPGILDVLTYSWDLDDNGSYDTYVQNPGRLFPNEGEFSVTLRVTDDSGAFGTDMASVVITRDKPKITGIPDQTVNEGGEFPPIALDNYIEDPFHADNQLVWQVSGNVALVVTLSNRILTVSPPDGDWNGAETLILTATDPDANRDSTRVRFTVLPVNDPPVWISHVPGITILEDSSAAVFLDSLRARVRDVDDPIGAITFSVRGNKNIQWSLDGANERIILTPAPAWKGTEKLAFAATDGSGATALDSVDVVVKEVVEPPSPFSLVEPLYYHAFSWPDTLRFRWHPSRTVDSIGVVYYSWSLREQGGIIDPIRRDVVFDTVFALPTQWLPLGIFFWNVEAVDQYGQARRSDNTGILQIEQSGVDSYGNALPTEYRLFRNYPNPFNPSTQIAFSLPEAANVRLAVFNPLGQEVRILLNGKRSPGVYTVEWDTRDVAGNRVPSGVYIYRLEAGSKVFFGKMTLMQ